MALFDDVPPPLFSIFGKQSSVSDIAVVLAAQGSSLARSRWWMAEDASRLAVDGDDELQQRHSSISRRTLFPAYKLVSDIAGVFGGARLQFGEVAMVDGGGPSRLAVEGANSSSGIPHLPAKSVSAYAKVRSKDDAGRVRTAKGEGRLAKTGELRATTWAMHPCRCQTDELRAATCAMRRCRFQTSELQVSDGDLWPCALPAAQLWSISLLAL
nr:hypothetical protein Iba_chr12aCG11340 [Ipomoea batatas]